MNASFPHLSWDLAIQTCTLAQSCTRPGFIMDYGSLQAEIGDTGMTFQNVAREWRCKYSPGPSGGPGDSESLKSLPISS